MGTSDLTGGYVKPEEIAASYCCPVLDALSRMQAERGKDGYGIHCRAVMSFELKNRGFCDTMVIQRKIL